MIDLVLKSLKRFAMNIFIVCASKMIEIIILQGQPSPFRMATRKGTAKWTVAFHHFMDESQALFQSVYGMKLKIDN